MLWKMHTNLEAKKWTNLGRMWFCLVELCDLLVSQHLRNWFLLLVVLFTKLLFFFFFGWIWNMQELRAFRVFDYWKAMVLLGLELIGINVEDPWVGDFHFRDLRIFMNNCFATRAVHSVLRWLVLNMKMGILLNLTFIFLFFKHYLWSTHLYNLVPSLMGLVMCKGAGQKLFVFI